MLTLENSIRLCDDCPLRDMEGDSEYGAVTGDLVSRNPRYMNARFEFIRDPAETPDIPAQEFATFFVDTEGNTTPPLLPGVELEDIAKCDQPVVSSRSGFFHRRKHYDCGAQALKLYASRQRLNKKTS